MPRRFPGADSTRTGLRALPNPVIVSTGGEIQETGGKPSFAIAARDTVSTPQGAPTAQETPEYLRNFADPSRTSEEPVRAAGVADDDVIDA
jgi:hypothetical protein